QAIVAYTANAVTVNLVAAATHFQVSAPASATAGNAFTFTVTALDQFNNVATGYGGTVHFTCSDGQAVLPANSSLSGGTGSFSATHNSTLTLHDALPISQAIVAYTANAVTVNLVAAATHFQVSAPASATAGNAFTFTVTALDQFNNVAT